MNYLELCQRLSLECGMSGTIDTLVGAEGQTLRAKTWIDQAWSDALAIASAALSMSLLAVLWPPLSGSSALAT